MRVARSRSRASEVLPICLSTRVSMRAASEDRKKPANGWHQSSRTRTRTPLPRCGATCSPSEKRQADAFAGDVEPDIGIIARELVELACQHHLRGQAAPRIARVQSPTTKPGNLIQH